jgi:DNA-binding transcriptional ArsR family regulator
VAPAVGVLVAALSVTEPVGEPLDRAAEQEEEGEHDEQQHGDDGDQYRVHLYHTRRWYRRAQRRFDTCGQSPGPEPCAPSQWTVRTQDSCATTRFERVMSLLPSSPEVSVEENPRVVGLDSDEADALMRALSSDTAREMLSSLHEEPLPPSKLADEVDTTLQNAQYHLERLSDAGAIEVVGTAYSEKGREMDVYAPADKPLVIFAGREDQASGIRAALRRLVGGLFALLFGAVAVQEVFGRGVGRLAPSLFGTGSSGADGGGAGGSDLSGNATGAGTPTQTPGQTPSRTPPPETTSGGGDVGIFNTGDESATATETAAAGGGAGGDGGSATATADPSVTATPAGTPQPTAEPTAMDTATQAPEATSTATQAAADGAATGATPTPTPVNETVTETVRMTTEAAAGAGDPAMGLPPGVAFFLGGAIVLGVAVALTYR